MSSFFDFLRGLFCRADEPVYARTRFDDDDRLPVSASIETHETLNSSRFRSPDFPPSSCCNSQPPLTSITSSESHYYPRRDTLNSSRFRSPDSPPSSSYKSPSASQYKPPLSSFVSSSKPTPSSSQPKHKPTSSPSPKPPLQFPSPSSPKLPPVYKSVLSPRQDANKTAYAFVEEDSVPVFIIPEDIKALIKNDIVPKILNRPLSPATYKDYFAALLYSEDFYLEKWSEFLLNNVTLELKNIQIDKKGEKEDKTFVAFELDSVREKRPFLLSRDLVFARPVDNSTAEPFQGFMYKVVKSNHVLVEYKDAFYSQHYSNKKYDISFSFNRVCLKRAHHAVETASNALFQNFIFPDCDARESIHAAPPLLSTTCHNLRRDQRSAVEQILRIKGSPPYIVSGPESSRTGVVVSEAVYQLRQKSPECRILICAPTNSCCDKLMTSLAKVIPKSAMFRANAAFREKDGVPEDVLRSSLHNESCFYCPPIEKLRKYSVIFSTFISSFRLHDKGIGVGHFSHIFLVEASSAIEPETLVTLTNFADKTTSVIVTGNPQDSPRWVRADIARNKGLKISYFERLCKCSPYKSLSPLFITQLDVNYK